MPCCTASSRVAATLAVAAKACEVIAGRLLQGLAGGTEAAVVAGSWKGAAAPAVAAEACELITGKLLQELARSTTAGVVAQVRKRGKGRRRRRWWRHFAKRLSDLYHHHSSQGSLSEQIDGAPRLRR